MFPLLMSRTVAGEDDYTGRKMPEIVTIGDSITQYGPRVDYDGWTSQIQYKYIRKRNVLNMGFTGFTTRDFKRLIDDILEATNNPVIFILFVGANDAAINNPATVPLEEYGQNLTYICQKIKKPLILVTPPPVYNAPNRTIENTALYRDKVIQVGAALNITVLNNWTFLNETCFVDGLHFNALGNTNFYNNLWPLIESKVGSGTVFLQ